MAVAIHITGMLAAIGFSAVYVRAFGRRPTAGRIGVGLVAALGWLLVYATVTLILHPEGQSSLIPGVMGVCSWLALSTIRPMRKAMLVCLGLFLYFCLLWVQYFTLATSSHYTNNPRWRLKSIQGADRLARVTPRKVTIRPVAHTWLTGLYAVDPPMGESPSRRQPSP